MGGCVDDVSFCYEGDEMCQFVSWSVVFFFFFKADDGIRVLVRSRGLGDVYKRQSLM